MSRSVSGWSGFCEVEATPRAARRVAQTIYNGCERLRSFQYPGRSSFRVAEWRELTLPPLPYIVVYRVTESAIEIGGIFHAAQDCNSSDFAMQ